MVEAIGKLTTREKRCLKKQTALLMEMDPNRQNPMDGTDMK